MTAKNNTQTHQSAISVLEPMRVASSDAVLWNSSTDLIVVGWGAAGASATLQARESGLDVVLIERFAGGGASKLSGGIVYAGGGTKYQVANGYADTIDNMFTYLQKENKGVVSDATLRRFCEDSKGNLEWLEKHGARYDGTYLKHKTSYPSKPTFFYYSGNEMVPAYRDARHPPIPRGHRTKGDGMSGEALMDALQNATRQCGATIMTQTTVRRLVVDASNRVIGVECYSLPAGHALTLKHAALTEKIPKNRNFFPAKAQAMRNEQRRIEDELIASGAAKPMLLRARKGVVLATGGFIFNLEMIEKHAPHYAPSFLLGAAGCDGSGIRLGQGLGGTTAHLNNISAWRFITPPAQWPLGIVVNRKGERFCNEQVYGERLGYEIMEKQGTQAWLILDKRLRSQCMRECITGGWWYFQWLPALITMLMAKKASTPEELAAKIGADPATLRQQLDAYNRAIDQPSGDELHPSDPQGKAHDMCQKLDTAPYYALDIGVLSPYLPMATITLGGLQVNEDSGLVKNGNGQDIPGLYAVGRTAVGIPSSRYVSGLSLADCVFSGRRAARHAAGVAAN